MPSKVRLGVIGAGWWAAENHIPVLQSREDVEIAGICRLGREELRKAQERFGIPFGTEDYKELLDVKGLSGVIVSSPHYLHYEHSTAALERGLHVVCEKPMTLRASEARQLARLAEARKLHFLIPYGWNYTDLASEAKKMVDRGEIGEIEHVLCHMASALRDLFNGQDSWVSEKSFFKPVEGTWSDPGRGGGYAHGQLTHALGLLFWITPLDPSEAFAFSRSSKTGADLYDAAACRFKGGATGAVNGAGTMPVGSPFQVDIRLFGSEGMLLIDIERPRLELRRNDGRNVIVPLKREPGEYSCAEPLHHFVDLIQGKPVENCSSAVLGSRVVALLEALCRSAQSEQVERIKD